MRRVCPVCAVFEQTNSTLACSGSLNISSAPDTAPTLTANTLASGRL
jgi:hypothetical protein